MPYSAGKFQLENSQALKILALFCIVSHHKLRSASVSAIILLIFYIRMLPCKQNAKRQSARSSRKCPSRRVRETPRPASQEDMILVFASP